MRIDRPKDVSKTRKKSTEKSSGSGAKFVISGTSPSTNLTGMGGTQAISNIGALLSAQEVDDTTVKREEAIKNGSDMLDVLDKLKVGLLGGRVSPKMLNRMRILLAEKRQLAGEGKLQSVLSQIEVRAEVELAKLAQQKSLSSISR